MGVELARRLQQEEMDRLAMEEAANRERERQLAAAAAAAAAGADSESAAAAAADRTVTPASAFAPGEDE